MSISLRAIEIISRMKSKGPTLEIKVFRSLHRVVILTSKIKNKNAVVVNENSDHNRITSMSCLKKVIDTVETECGKSFTNVVLWSDGMDTRSRFIFQLLAGTLFLNKSLCWFYNEGQHGKFPMDAVGETVKYIIFRKV